MRAPSKAYPIQSVTLYEVKGEVRPRQRLATSRVVNSAYREVTNYMKPEGARYWAVTQVKGLSPEIVMVPEVEAVHLAEGSSLISVKRRGDKTLAGSETTARYQKDRNSGDPGSFPRVRSKHYQAYRRQGKADDFLGVGSAHSSEEVPETGWSEGADR